VWTADVARLIREMESMCTSAVSEHLRRRTNRAQARVPVLLDRYGFGQVARLVYVATAADSYVVGQKLQRDDFEQWR